MNCFKKILNLQQMLTYLDENVHQLDCFLQKSMPKVKAVLPEASYLAWLDFSAYGLPHKELAERLVNKAHVVLNDGTSFGGDAYQCCFRLNLGCPRATLMDVLQRVKEALAQ